MKQILCLLAILTCGVPAGSAHLKVEHVRAHSNGTKAQLLRATQKDECFKRGMPAQGVDDEIEEEVSDINMQKTWNGRKVVYKIDNFPRCTEISPETVKKLIDEAADTWNKVQEANILLVNFDDLEKRNEVDFNMKFGEEFSNEIEELDELIAPNSNQQENEGVDIIVSFEPCTHLRYRDKRPNAFEEDFGENCDQVYAHAHYYGDIHFNELMTWTDRNYDNDELVKSDNLLKPNLYSIALHEFGHSLGLRHTQDKEDVMFWDFSGGRIYDRLELSPHDITELQQHYLVKESCKDKSGMHAICMHYPERYCNSNGRRSYCPKTCGDCDPCGRDLKDDYIKCDDRICSDLEHPMRQFCRKTCKLCEPEPDDITECKDGTSRDCEILKKNVDKKRRKCKKSVWRTACPLTCNACKGSAAGRRPPAVPIP